ncbi:hypothetical protein N9X39_04120 [Alphaproteobacteria bacterium]|nr:hypothetical protein [Alphaproteobacteria bacterium]
MPAGLVYLICQILLALVLLAGCRPVYYGAISIAEFEDGEKHALLGKDFRRVIAQLGEPTDIIFDKAEAMVWIYEVDEASSNPLQILPVLTTGLPVKRKILIIEFDQKRHVASSDIKRSKTHLVGMIGRVNHLTRTVQAKKRVRSALAQLKSIN